MGRLNIFLLALVIFCAIVVVEQQHSARTLFVALGQEQQAEQQIEVALYRSLDWDQSRFQGRENPALNKLPKIFSEPPHRHIGW